MNTETDAVIIEPASEHRSSVIWLHGLGADGHDFEPIVPELQLPDNAGIRFIFPHAPVRAVTINGGLSMRAWYDIKQIDLTREEDEKSVRESAGLVESYIQQELGDGITSDNIVLAGFSQGGAIVLYAGLRYARPLAGILALSTYMPLIHSLKGEINESNQNTAILQMHGSFDPVIPIGTAKKTHETLESLDCSVEWEEYPMQHGVCPPEIKHISDWLQKRLLSS